MYCKGTQKKSFWCLWTNLANFSSASIVDFEQVNAIERMALITCVLLKLVCQTCKMEYFAKIIKCWKPSTAFLKKLYLRYLTWFCISLWKWYVARKSKIMVMINYINLRFTLRKKSPYSKLFWSSFSRIRTEYGEILRISPYSVRMREIADQNNSKYGQVSRSVWVQ